MNTEEMKKRLAALRVQAEQFREQINYLEKQIAEDDARSKPRTKEETERLHKWFREQNRKQAEFRSQHDLDYRA
jgi:seryl-tRNA synthetase